MRREYVSAIEAYRARHLAFSWTQSQQLCPIRFHSMAQVDLLNSLKRENPEDWREIERVSREGLQLLEEEGPSSDMTEDEQQIGKCFRLPTSASCCSHRCFAA